MRRHHPNNERMKREYLIFLERAKRMSPSSVDQVAASIALFEENTNYKDFRKFHRSQAIAFLESQQRAANKDTGRPLAKSTVHSRLMAMKAFIQWLQGRAGFRSRIVYDDAEYFNPSANDERVAKARRQRPVPSLEQIRTAFDAMPGSTVVERRDRALFGFAVVSGARDNALASLSLRHVDMVQKTVTQDARTVRTKNAKTFASNFFPVDPIYVSVMVDWMVELQSLGFGLDDPLFPATAVEVGADRRFVASGVKPEFWKGANAVRRIFKGAFELAGLPYFHPHSFRSTLAIHGEKICRSAEAWQAYSQNFGHSSPMTTFTSYGEVPPYRQSEIFKELSDQKPVAGSVGQPVRLDDAQAKMLLEGIQRAIAGQ